IRQGIVLHRAIDTFTDTHAITRQAKVFFREPYGLYAGAIVDVAYDHYLANDQVIFGKVGAAGTDLAAFAQKTYAQVQENEAFLPAPFARMFFSMSTHDWVDN